ncbi:MAG: sigma-70 family RNA polymerase sigma factor [Candidatus Omnitrophota bacterium]
MNSEPISSSERELIERLRQGERPAFDTLVELYKNKGFGICYNLLGNAEDAKDVLQEAFIKVYLNIKNFKEEAKFSTWFYRIALNCSLDFLRRQKVRSKVLQPAVVDGEGKVKEAEDMRYEPHRIILNQELAANLDKYVAQLPKMQKLCFVLKHQNSLSNAEISRTLNCSLATVKVHLFRAVHSLQDKLCAYLEK